ncbi:MAG: 4-(cytidine 5'-diphospho)-2-C-methyl-D-erythritol kinase [Rhodospirillales bacterium]|nr:4-(cytidine 5'-diphospho)-2-C-methyl-D-erythritol kinase [Rhodospirillales bacterium]
MSASWTEAAPAKVNLSLHVTGRRADGYHLLDSLVVFAEVGDVLRAEPAPTLSLRLAGPFAAGLSEEPDNLVLRAARGLAALVGDRDAVTPPARAPGHSAEARPGTPAMPLAGAALTLDKRLPVASGIGGGSADAAAVLRLLVRLWGVAPDPAALHRLAQSLGADVPVCLECRSVRMRGIGEVLAPVPPLPACGLLLVNPGVGVATADVFRARQGQPFSAPPPLPAAWPDAVSLAAWLRDCGNDLEPPARALCPPIGTVLAAIARQPACLLARMSGSGATCFGLFPTEAEAQAAADRLRPEGWWCWGGALRPG